MRKGTLWYAWCKPGPRHPATARTSFRQESFRFSGRVSQSERGPIGFGVQQLPKSFNRSSTNLRVSLKLGFNRIGAHASQSRQPRFRVLSPIHRASRSTISTVGPQRSHLHSFQFPLRFLPFSRPAMSHHCFSRSHDLCAERSLSELPQNTSA